MTEQEEKAILTVGSTHGSALLCSAFLCFALLAELWRKLDDFGYKKACRSKNGTLGMFLPKCVIMAAAGVINSRLMCVRWYLSSSSSSSRGERSRTRVTGQHNERDMACQLGQLLL